MDTDCTPTVKKRLWVIDYKVTLTESTVHGVALVKAANEHIAENILTHDSQFNAYRENFKIKRIEEVVESLDDMLLCEEYITD